MNKYEKQDIQELPSEYRPLGAWGYYGYKLLFSLPIIGFIALIVCALGNSNINRRSFARSYFCAVVIDIILVALLIFAFCPYIIQWLQALAEMLGFSAQ